MVCPTLYVSPTMHSVEKCKNIKKLFIETNIIFEILNPSQIDYPFFKVLKHLYYTFLFSYYEHEQIGNEFVFCRKGIVIYPVIEDIGNFPMIENIGNHPVNKDINNCLVIGGIGNYPTTDVINSCLAIEEDMSIISAVPLCMHMTIQLVPPTRLLEEALHYLKKVDFKLEEGEIPLLCWILLSHIVHKRNRQQPHCHSLTQDLQGTIQIIFCKTLPIQSKL